MIQYLAIRQEHPKGLLFFQVGDFYELFFDDAKKAAAFLGITLTKKGTYNGEPIPLCGVPVHAITHYLHKLVKGGFAVIICDQASLPVAGKIVERKVSKVLTPGTLTDSALLDEKSASYLFTFFPHEDQWGLLFGELLTAQLFATLLPSNAERSLGSELVRFLPDEIILPQTKYAQKFMTYFKQQGYAATVLEHDPLVADGANAKKWIQQQFGADKKAYLSENPALEYALHTFYAYMHKNQTDALSQFKSLSLYNPDDFMILDPSTQKNLELIKNNHDGSRKNSLLSVLDKAQTTMGSRMVKKWLLRPLVDKNVIMQRHDAVAYLVKEWGVAQQLQELFSSLGDMERIIGRIALGRGQFVDFRALLALLPLIPQIKNILTQQCTPYFLSCALRSVDNFLPLLELLQVALHIDDDKDWLIKAGFDKKLDETRSSIANADQKLIAFEQEQQKRTGISSLKIIYNAVQGYCIEVTKTHYAIVPDDYIARQKLVGRSRFTTVELQALQLEITQAKSQVVSIEKEIFERIKKEVVLYVGGLRRAAYILAQVDAILSFSQVAYDNEYVCPEYNNNRDICVVAGRHPVVEQIGAGKFIPNDINLTDKSSVLILTGPNMGGKSTYLRQTALLVIMSQAGSFVPAEKANLPFVDRVFTRIGAGDNLAEGKSTFLVEMEEAALICLYATPDSLVILDEVGRGTSTFDGLALAQAIVEYIYKSVQARCLFATHYHELTDLSKKYPGIESYYAASSKDSAIPDAPVLFLYKIVRGIADGSFGIDVARIAGIPEPIITNAENILDKLHQNSGKKSVVSSAENLAATSHHKLDATQKELLIELERLREQNGLLQNKIFESSNLWSQVQNINCDDISPRQAFDFLCAIKEKTEK